MDYHLNRKIKIAKTAPLGGRFKTFVNGRTYSTKCITPAVKNFTNSSQFTERDLQDVKLRNIWKNLVIKENQPFTKDLILHYNPPPPTAGRFSRIKFKIFATLDLETVKLPDAALSFPPANGGRMARK